MSNDHILSSFVVAVVVVYRWIHTWSSNHNSKHTLDSAEIARLPAIGLCEWKSTFVRNSYRTERRRDGIPTRRADNKRKGEDRFGWTVTEQLIRPPHDTCVYTLIKENDDIRIEHNLVIALITFSAFFISSSLSVYQPLDLRNAPPHKQFYSH